MNKPHITPGRNGYTTTAGKQIAAMREKAERKERREKENHAAELFAKRYLADHPETTQLTGYEIANEHLHEK